MLPDNRTARAVIYWCGLVLGGLAVASEAVEQVAPGPVTAAVSGALSRLAAYAATLLGLTAATNLSPAPVRTFRPVAAPAPPAVD